MSDSQARPPRPPVVDWSSDWDHLDPSWRNDPYPIWDDLRARCPVAETQRYQGAYLVTRYEDVKTLTHDTETFSSRRLTIREQALVNPPPAPPLSSDPPEHKGLKQVLIPPLLPQEVAKLEPVARRICRELVDGFARDGGCDAAEQYSRQIVVRVLATMLGVPESDGAFFIRCIHEFLEEGLRDDAIAMKALKDLTLYFMGEIQERVKAPRDDLITRVLSSEVDGKPIAKETALGMLRLLVIAGIDTTWSAIGSCFWHLAQTPEDVRRLVAEPALMPTAVEELLRAYAPVSMGREIMRDTEVSGCPVRKGKMLLLSFPAANRDPAAFPDADKVMLDRKENRHAAFGLGIHRCVGAHLARMEITVAIEEWLKQIPQFRLDPTKSVVWSEGTVRGPRALPIVFEDAQAGTRGV